MAPQIYISSSETFRHPASPCTTNVAQEDLLPLRDRSTISHKGQPVALRLRLGHPRNSTGLKPQIAECTLCNGTDIADSRLAHRIAYHLGRYIARTPSRNHEGSTCVPSCFTSQEKFCSECSRQRRYGQV